MMFFSQCVVFSLRQVFIVYAADNQCNQQDLYKFAFTSTLCFTIKPPGHGSLMLWASSFAPYCEDIRRYRQCNKIYFVL